MKISVALLIWRILHLFDQELSFLPFRFHLHKNRNFQSLNLITLLVELTSAGSKQSEAQNLPSYADYGYVNYGKIDPVV